MNVKDLWKMIQWGLIIGLLSGALFGALVWGIQSFFGLVPTLKTIPFEVTSYLLCCSIATIVCLVLINYFDAYIRALLAGMMVFYGLLSLVIYTIPPSHWVANAMIVSGLLMFVWYLLCAIAAAQEDW